MLRLKNGTLVMPNTVMRSSTASQTADQPARLHRNGGMPLHGKPLAAHVMRGLEGRIGVAATDLYARCIGPGVLVNQHRAIVRRLPAQDRRQVLDLGRDQRGGVLGDVRAGRDHDGDRLADIADLVGGERQLQEILEPGHRGDPRADRLQGRPEVGMGEDADHTRARQRRRSRRCSECVHAATRCGTRAACSIPSRWTSSTYRPAPVSSRASSRLAIGSPTCAVMMASGNAGKRRGSRRRSRYIPCSDRCFPR